MNHQELVDALRGVNDARARGEPDLAFLNSPRLLDSSTRLAVYGSLAPGESNHQQLAGLTGTWQTGAVRGHLAQRGWGQHMGFPGIRWDPMADHVRVQLFCSPDLPVHWSRLDAFEGRDYRRILVPVETRGEIIVANIYEVLDPAG